MTYEEYLKQHEELTQQEQENKRKYEALVDDIESRHRENVKKEMDLFHEIKRKEREAYLDKQNELGIRKRALKMEFKLEMDRQREQMALLGNPAYVTTEEAAQSLGIK